MDTAFAVFRIEVEDTMKKLILIALVMFFPMTIHAGSGVLSGLGTSGAPYLVEDYADLKAVATTGLDKVYRLNADIDASVSASENNDSGFTPIGISASTPFTGVFHGGGHVIRGLTIKHAQWVGLFGDLSSVAVIDSLGLINVDIRGQDYVGALVGMNDGVVSYSYASGTLGEGSSSFAGGLVGLNTGTVSYSYATSTVKGNNYVGGLVGLNSGLVRNSYATGAVKGYDQVGGFVGTNSGTVLNSYAMGSAAGFYYTGGLAGVNSNLMINTYATGLSQGDNYTGGLVGMNTDSVISSYWNAAICDSGFGSNSGTFGALGLTTTAMKSTVNFSNWSFSNDSAWQLVEGKTYPALRSIDNAPFAFADTSTSRTSWNISDLLKHAYDVETAQTTLVASLLDSTKNGDTLCVTYRVGESRVAIGDTLWGNVAQIVFTASPVSLKASNDVGIGNRLTVRFNASVLQIHYQTSLAGPVTIKLYDFKGNLIGLGHDGFQSMGTHSLAMASQVMAAGIYVVVIDLGGTTIGRTLAVKRSSNGFD